MKVFNLKAIKHKQMIAQSTREKLALSAIISDCVNFDDIFIRHEILLPKTTAASKHFHTKREEMIIILKGQVIVSNNNEEKKLFENDFVGFKPNEEHLVQNASDNQAEILVISSNSPNDEVIYNK